MKAVEGRIDREIEQQEGLLQDIERVPDLKLMPLSYHKNRIIEAKNFSLRYPDSTDRVIRNLTFVPVSDEDHYWGKHGDVAVEVIRDFLVKGNERDQR